jgi:Phospholipase_D-nuclease N-terminal
MSSLPLALSTLGWILTIVVLTIAFMLWLYCLVEIVARRDLGAGAKLVWALFLIVLAPLAIVAYLLFGRARV